MKKLILLLCVCCLHAADVRVDLTQPGKKVSPNLFGLFIEEINHGGDGGLYAELVRNGSFAEAETLDAWAAVRTGEAQVNLFFDETEPLSAAKKRSLRIHVSAQAGEAAGVSNEGYWGVAVKEGASYQFSTYARGEGPLTVALASASGEVYGQAELTGLKPGWNRFTASIKSNTTDAAARLTITAARSGTFWLNMVSLRPGGDIFRADLLQKLQDLKPGFLRFPGGTYVQGNYRAAAYRWKNTIGDLENRAGHPNSPWVYWSSDNMGFHEYLLLAERLGAVPMYVAYGGMTWTPSSRSAFGLLDGHRIPVSDYPLEQMGPIVQEAVDAIEYANGPVTSTWGALRAKAGHPAPFGLKYVEIGNEDGRNPLYAARYRMFYDAIKARFPEVEIIANSRRGPNASLPMDVLDEHLYTRPMSAIEMAAELDERPRDGSKSLLGEYAVQMSGGDGNMRAALAEAVLLGGIERNSDIMPLASFAPLLANVHAINWRPNPIYFDGVSSYGTPSYYVQKMLADSRLDTVVPIQIDAPELAVGMEGEVDAHGFDAEAEFQHAKVDGSGDQYTYSLRARKTSGDGGLRIRFAVQNDGRSYLAWFLGVKRRGQLEVWAGGGPTNSPRFGLESSFGGPLGDQLPGTLDTGRWYDIKIQVEGRRVRCYLDGQQIHDMSVPETLGPSVYGSAGRTPDGDIVVRLVNTSPLYQDVSIELAGASAARHSGVMAEMYSPDLDAENSLAEPRGIAPVERRLTGLAGKFDQQLAGNSFTVFRLTPESR